MRKVIIAIALLALTLGVSYAQVPNNPNEVGGLLYGTDNNPLLNNHEYLASGSTTVFANVASLGLKTTDNPGYIVLAGFDRDSNTHLYYLWVNNDGELMIASAPTLSQFSSFPTGNWSTFDDDKDGINTVGDQS